MCTIRRSMFVLRVLRYVEAYLHACPEIAEHLVPNEQPLHESGPEVVVECLGAMPARGGFVDDFSSADFSALLSEKRYAVVVKARDVSHIIHASECGDPDRGGIRGGYRGFCFETPAARDSVDAHGIGGEEGRRDEEWFESFLKSFGVIFVEDDEGIREGIKVCDRRERHGVDHPEENLEVLGGIVYINDWEFAFTLLGRLG